MQNIKMVRRLPKVPDAKVVAYHLPPRRMRGDDRRNSKRAKERDERTDRNNGCLVKDPEQNILYTSSVAVIGLGGMGGYQCDTFVRLGIGDLWIADNGVFDQSNLQRQWAARKATIGKEKAIATANQMREIADDYDLHVSHLGFGEQTADLLVAGRNVVVDMIEFWALADRIYLHRTCAKHKVVVINWNSIVHSTFGCRYDYAKTATPGDLWGYETLLERALGMTYERARYLQSRYDSRTITREETVELMDAVFRVYIPEETEYFDSPTESTVKAFRQRLLEEGKAPVLSTNPMFAAGVCATEVYFELMRQKSPIRRAVPATKPFPWMTKIDIGFKAFKEICVLPPTEYCIRLVNNADERIRAISFISLNMQKRHGAFPPPGMTPEHVFVALLGEEIVGAIAIEFGTYDAPLPFETYFEFSRDNAEVPYVREQTIYYSRWNSLRRKLGPAIWLYASEYALAQGAVFSSATAKPEMFDHCERTLGFRWGTISKAEIRRDGVGEEEKIYFFDGAPPRPCLGVLAEQVRSLRPIVERICFEENIKIGSEALMQ